MRTIAIAAAAIMLATAAVHASPRIVIKEVSGDDLVRGRTECLHSASACVVPGDSCLIIVPREADFIAFTARHAPGFDWRSQRNRWIVELAGQCGSNACAIFLITAWAPSAGIPERRSHVPACVA
jgi:hypothetical protein